MERLRKESKGNGKVKKEKIVKGKEVMRGKLKNYEEIEEESEQESEQESKEESKEESDEIK